MALPKRISVTLLLLVLIGGLLFAGLRFSPKATTVETVALNGHTVEYSRHGSGTPTIVFLHGGLGGGKWGVDAWRSWLTRFDAATFTYSRPGFQNSAPVQKIETPAVVADELHDLLSTLRIKPPFILVGASMGGLYARVYALRYPADVAGLVIVDGSHERQWVEGYKVSPTRYPMPSAKTFDISKPDIAGLMPTIVSGKLDVSGNLPDVPLAVVTSLHHTGKTAPIPPEDEQAWRRLQEEIFESSTYAIHIVTAKSGHDLANEDPELVFGAIKWVLTAARESKLVDHRH